MEFRIKFDRPFGKQQDFIDSPAKRKIIVAGRRFGKTTATSIIAGKMALDGRKILQAAPTTEQTDQFWSNIKRYFAEPIKAKVIYKNETKRLLEFPSGGIVRTKTAWDEDTMRGDYADLLILEEYSLMEETAWTQVGAPMLLDNNGDAIFIFTPKRRNHAFELYQKYQSDGRGSTAVWHFTSYDNPYITREALAEVTEDMLEDDIKQEILAEFLENAGQVFRKLDKVMDAPLDPAPADHRGHRIVGGVDWGMAEDWTAISLGCEECRVEVARDRFKKIGYNYQRERIKALCEKWRPYRLMVELNSIGEPNFEQLQLDGLPVVGFTMTASSKPPLIQGLGLAFERGSWQFQKDKVWTGELQAFERRVNPVTNRSTFSAPVGMHDDTVIARALMVKCGSGENWLIY